MIGYLIDMDDVIYRGGQLIPGADRFVNGLREANIPFLLLTSSSERTRRDLAADLQRLGIDITEYDLISCAMTPAMLRAAREELALPTDQTVVIGDSLETDIVGGVQLNYKTILVLTGSTRREDAARFAYPPDLIVESLADLDPSALERQFGSQPADGKPSLSHSHPSHRPRRKPAIAGAF